LPERKPHLDNLFPFWEHSEVRVISRRTIREFAAQHPDALQPLLHWAKATEASSWQTPADLRSTFNSADFVDDLTVFNIGGNKYRLIAFVQYQREIVYIKAVLTHKDYDKGAWKR
jgi:mRNA interferase HigB